jgi:hypothetical protein
MGGGPRGLREDWADRLDGGRAWQMRGAGNWRIEGKSGGTEGTGGLGGRADCADERGAGWAGGRVDGRRGAKERADWAAVVSQGDAAAGRQCALPYALRTHAPWVATLHPCPVCAYPPPTYPRSVRAISGPHICGDALDIQPGSGLVLTGSWRNSNPLQLWDLGSGRLVTNLPWWQPEPDGCLIYAARFGTGAAAGTVVAGGSGTKPMVRVYKLVRAGGRSAGRDGRVSAGWYMVSLLVRSR